MYLKLIYLCCVTTCILAAPPVNEVPSDVQQNPVVPIISISAEYEPNGKFKYNYETGDGIKREETTYDKVLPQGKSHSDCSNEGGEDDDSDEIHVQKGSYSYTAPDGTVVSVRYIADENGFQPTITEVTHPNSQASNNLTPNAGEQQKDSKDKKDNPEITPTNKAASDSPTKPEQLNQEASEKKSLNFGDRLAPKNEKPSKKSNKKNSRNTPSETAHEIKGNQSLQEKNTSRVSKPNLYNANMTTPTVNKDESDNTNESSTNDETNNSKDKTPKKEEIEPKQKSGNLVTASEKKNFKLDHVTEIPNEIKNPVDKSVNLSSMNEPNKNETSLNMEDKRPEKEKNDTMSSLTESSNNETNPHEKYKISKKGESEPQQNSGSNINASRNNTSEDINDIPKETKNSSETMVEPKMNKTSLDAPNKSSKQENNLEDGVKPPVKNYNKSNITKEAPKDNMNSSVRKETMSPISESSDKDTNTHKKNNMTKVDKTDPEQQSQNTVTTPIGINKMNGTKDKQEIPQETKKPSERNDTLSTVIKPDKNETNLDAKDNKQKNETRQMPKNKIKTPVQNKDESDNMNETFKEKPGGKNGTLSSVIESPKNKITEENEIAPQHKPENNETGKGNNNNNKNIEKTPTENQNSTKNNDTMTPMIEPSKNQTNSNAEDKIARKEEIKPINLKQISNNKTEHLDDVDNKKKDDLNNMKQISNNKTKHSDDVDSKKMDDQNKLTKLKDNSNDQKEMPIKSPIKPNPGESNPKKQNHVGNESDNNSNNTKQNATIEENQPNKEVTKSLKPANNASVDGNELNTPNLNSLPNDTSKSNDDVNASPYQNPSNLEKEAEKHEKTAEHAAKEAAKAAEVATDAADVAHKAADATEKIANTLDQANNESRQDVIDAAKKHAHIAGQAAKEAERAAEVADNAAKDAKNSADAAEKFVQLVQSSSHNNNLDENVPKVNGDVDNAEKSIHENQVNSILDKSKQTVLSDSTNL